MTGTSGRRLQFGVFFQSANTGTIWSDARSGSQYDFETFRRVAQTAERGLFSAFFVGEGLRIRENFGQIHDLDIAGRPEAQTQLSALAAVTSHIGLVATHTTTFHDPYEVARRFATLDLLSEGRAGWNVVTTDDAWIGENMRRGGYLDHADRYRRAAEFVRGTWRLWDAGASLIPSKSAHAACWGQRGNDVIADGKFISFTAPPPLPPTPQRRPVIFQAGDSDEGREFAAAHADVIFSAHPEFEDSVSFAADLRRRLAAYGRHEADVKFFPGQQFVLAATAAEAQEKFEWVTHAQISPQTALRYLEIIWGRDLSDYDPGGPLPAEDPASEKVTTTRGAALRSKDAVAVARQWRAVAAEKSLSIREFVIHQTSRRILVGSYSSVADRLVGYAESGVVDGFNISPYIVPDGLDDIVNGLVPELQERGIYPTEYPGATLRENLGLPPLTSQEAGAALGGQR